MGKIKILQAGKICHIHKGPYSFPPLVHWTLYPKAFGKSLIILDQSLASGLSENYIQSESQGHRFDWIDEAVSGNWWPLAHESVGLQDTLSQSVSVWCAHRKSSLLGLSKSWTNIVSTFTFLLVNSVYLFSVKNVPFLFYFLVLFLTLVLIFFVIYLFIFIFLITVSLCTPPYLSWNSLYRPG